MQPTFHATPASQPTLFLSDDDIARLADWSDTVQALERAYASPVAPSMVPPRSMARGERLWLRGLSAVLPTGRHMGSKQIAASMRNRCASYLISVFDQNTTELVALMDANRITGLRTAATAALAVRLLAPVKPLRLAVLGSGFEARGLLQAVAAALEVSSVRVFSPTPANRERFAQSFSECGLKISAAPSAEDAVRGADVLLCAARSHDETPVLQGRWLQPGMTVVSLGSTLPEQREVDEETLRLARTIVADMPDEVAHDTGDALAAAAAGVDLQPKLVSLGDVCAGRHAGRTGDDDIVVFKSVGSALQDVVVAEMLLDQARARGLGTPLPVTVRPVRK